MLEVTIAEPDDFFKSKRNINTYRCCIKKRKQIISIVYNILHKQGRYFIVHFKELFMLDGKEI